jgi:hypothetical protein
MADYQTTPRYKAGDEVRLVLGGLTGKIKEVLPARTPEAHTLYMVVVPMDPEPMLFPVRESEIEKG